MPNVTVIIPVYNTAEYVCEAIDSVLAQTLPDIEVIAVDDGSTDGSAALLQSYGDRITVITKANGGQAAARNDALAVAHGDYICFLDSDDTLQPNTLERCHALCERDQLDFVFFDARSFGPGADSESGWQDYHRAAHYPGIRRGPSTMQAMLHDGRYRCSVCMSLFRTAFLQRIGARFYPGIIHEDELFSALVYFRAERIEAIDAEFYNRRVRGESTMTKRFSRRNVDGYLTVIREAAAYVDGSETRQAYRLLVQSILLSLMHNGWCLPAKEKRRIIACLLRHPYAFRLRPFAILLLKKG